MGSGVFAEVTYTIFLGEKQDYVAIAKKINEQQGAGYEIFGEDIFNGLKSTAIERANREIQEKTEEIEGLNDQLYVTGELYSPPEYKYDYTRDKASPYEIMTNKIKQQIEQFKSEINEIENRKENIKNMTYEATE